MKKKVQLTVGENRSYEEHDENYKNKKRLKITVITQENLEELLVAIAI